MENRNQILNDRLKWIIKNVDTDGNVSLNPTSWDTKQFIDDGFIREVLGHLSDRFIYYVRYNKIEEFLSRGGYPNDIIKPPANNINVVMGDNNSNINQSSSLTNVNQTKKTIAPTKAAIKIIPTILGAIGAIITGLIILYIGHKLGWG